MIRRIKQKWREKIGRKRIMLIIIFMKYQEELLVGEYGFFPTQNLGILIFGMIFLGRDAYPGWDGGWRG